MNCLWHLFLTILNFYLEIDFDEFFFFFFAGKTFFNVELYQKFVKFMDCQVCDSLHFFFFFFFFLNQSLIFFLTITAIYYIYIKDIFAYIWKNYVVITSFHYYKWNIINILPLAKIMELAHLQYVHLVFFFLFSSK